MSEVENRPPTTPATVEHTKTGNKVPNSNAKSKLLGSERKKLQTLQPSGMNQTLLVGADGQLRVSSSLGKKDEVKIFRDPVTSTPEKTNKSIPELIETGVQVTVDVAEAGSQVENQDIAQAKAEAQMYGEELGEEYWKDLAEKRREALEVSLIENEELHTSLSLEREEKSSLAKERDSLKEMAEQAEELAKIVKSLVTEEGSDTEVEEEADEDDNSNNSKDEA